MERTLPPFELTSEGAPKNFVLSIKPEYAFKIIEGEKTVELRKKFPVENVEGGLVIVYASSPVQEIIGYVLIKKVEKLPISSLWERFRRRACVRKKFFDAYFNNLDAGYAISLTKPVKLKNPIKIKDLHETIQFSVPQSFSYASGKLLEAINA